MDVTAVTERSGAWWAVCVPEVSGVFTQVRRLDQVAAQTADAVALMLDCDPSSINVAVHVRPDAGEATTNAR